MENQQQKLTAAMVLYQREIEPVVNALSKKCHDLGIDHLMVFNLKAGTVAPDEQQPEACALMGVVNIKPSRSPLLHACQAVIRSDNPIEIMGAIMAAKSMVRVSADHSSDKCGTGH